MEELNEKLLQFFRQYFRSGIIGLVGTKDMIGLAIREAQKPIALDGKASLWSHSFLLDDLRLDRRGPGNAKSRSPYIFESDLKINLIKPQIRNGAQENWLGKWCVQNVENAALIDFALSEDQKDDVLATALQLVDEQVLYPIQELLGTWWSIITGQQWLANPLDEPHAMYCSSFVRHCYREAGRDFMGPEVSLSNTTPEHIAQAGIKAGRLQMYKP